MADSATPRTAEFFAVAFSGGRDSTALLHASACSARELGLRVLALHVNHGLSPKADDWMSHCREQCHAWAVQGLQIEFRVTRLKGQPAPAQSVEAWAREGRYAALAAMCREAGVDLLLLAQHRRDQAETLLLQALRGAGVAGLAGMPASQWRDGIRWVRPWLAQPREAIEAHLTEHELEYVEDDSNADSRFARNRLRLQVWPALSEAFGQAEASLAQSAQWAQQSLALQDEVAEADLQGRMQEGRLDLSGLSPARARNALRAWLLDQTGVAPPASLMARITDLNSINDGAWPCAGGLLRRYRGRWRWCANAQPARPGPSQIVKLACAGWHAQPSWGGAWQLESVEEGGIGLALLQSAQMRARSGGEQFQRHPNAQPRSLKKAWQEAGVPAWERSGPLLFAGEQLLYVPGLGLDARVLALAGETQFALRWVAQP